MMSEWLLNMRIEGLYLPKKFYTPQNKFLATPDFGMATERWQTLDRLTWRLLVETAMST